MTDATNGAVLRREGSSALEGGYTPTHEAFRGIGNQRWCCTCERHRAMQAGWRKLRRGMSCKECADAHEERLAEKKAALAVGDAA